MISLCVHECVDIFSKCCDFFSYWSFLVHFKHDGRNYGEATLLTHNMVLYFDTNKWTFDMVLLCSVPLFAMVL